MHLMRCQKPEMDDYEATQGDSGRKGTERDTRKIAPTANALTGDREACLDAGMDAYASKPVRPEILESILAEVVGPYDAAAATIPDTASSDRPPLEAAAAPAVSAAIPPV
jgi:CheY-like chemotaxis protein